MGGILPASLHPCRDREQGADEAGGVAVSADERIERARLLYERFVFGGDSSVLAVADRELDAIMHGLFLERRNEDPVQLDEDPRELALFERAAQLYQGLGDVRGEAESLFWVGCLDRKSVMQ